MKNYKDKNIYIVGGSSGIGLSTAKLFFEKGANVIIFGRTNERLISAQKEIEGKRQSKDSQKILGMQMDVSIYENVFAVLSKAVSEFGVPHILINCAGRAYPNYFEKITPVAFDSTMKTNLYGVWNTVSVLSPHMKLRGGYIINVSSIAGFIGLFGYTDYCASKFAVIGFSEALRSELMQHKIKVSVLCPPDTDTPGFQAENNTKPDETRAISANAKLISPDDVAKELIYGIENEKFLIIPNFDGKLTFLVKRFFPSLVDFIIERGINKVRKKKNE